MWLARLELAQGKRKLSMRHMEFVAAEGNVYDQLSYYPYLHETDLARVERILLYYEHIC